MNERLHQLMRQAQSEAYAKASAKNKTNSPQNNTVWNEFPEVFAELIVRECADVMINDPRLSDVRSATRGCARSIKEHFGVEE